MYSPESISRDISSNLMFSGNDSGTSFKNDFLGSSSDLFQPAHVQQQNQQQSCGLLRYKSAPSSYFASYLDGSKNNSSSHNGDSSESDSIFTALMNCNEPSNEISHHHHQQLHGYSGAMKLEINEVESNPSGLQQNGNGFCSGNSTMEMPVGYQEAVNAGGGTVVGSYTVPVGVENQVQVRMNSNASTSNLIRQSSSPAGFLSGFDVMREVVNFSSNGTNGEVSSSTSGLNNHLNFTSGPSSSSRFMPSLAENGNKNGGTESPDRGQLGNGNETNRGYDSSFLNESWNGSPFNSLKRNRDGDLKMYSNFSGLDNQDGEPRYHTPGFLTHHLSLPKSAVEMAAIEKYLQFQQDSVPCKVRAKRGCATHPRSIAERMRRIRISERMKKLQELFPNMDKQTNTADMLDLAVEYIKDLQNQVQTLTETRARCTCSSKPPQSSNSAV